MPYATEIAIIQANEEFRKDPSLLHPLFEHVKAAGAVGVYLGFTEENPSEAYLLIIWKSIEDHYALMKDTVVFPKLGPIVDGCTSAPVSVQHAHFEPDASLPLALNAPLFSLAHVLKRKEGLTEEALSDILRSLTHREGRSGSIKTHGGGFGKLVERDEYILVFGWDKLEDHLAVTEAAGEDGENVRKLIEYTERKLVHIKLQPYFKFEG